jgi:hypothetical protein
MPGALALGTARAAGSNAENHIRRTSDLESAGVLGRTSPPESAAVLYA